MECLAPVSLDVCRLGCNGPVRLKGCSFYQWILGSSVNWRDLSSRLSKVKHLENVSFEGIHVQYTQGRRERTRGGGKNNRETGEKGRKGDLRFKHQGFPHRKNNKYPWWRLCLKRGIIKNRKHSLLSVWIQQRGRRVCAHPCMCTRKGQRRTLGALIYCFPFSSFETESLTEPRATLDVSKAPVILLSPPYTVLGF